MALQKRSRLHQVHLTFDENGTYVTGDALFQEGAWDTETQSWEGKPVAREYVLHNADAEGKKFLNDVIGVAAMKALETASVAAEALKKTTNDLRLANHEVELANGELKDALGARDNFAALHKEAVGQKMMWEKLAKENAENWRVASTAIGKIPGLIRKLFGAI